MKRIAPVIVRSEYLVCHVLNRYFYFTPDLDYAVMTDENNIVCSGWDSIYYFLSALRKIYHNLLHEKPEQVIQKIKEMYIENNMEIPNAWKRFYLLNRFDQIDEKILKGEYR